MGLFEISALLVTLAALFSYINHRWIRWPTTIGLMVIALVMSLVLVLLGELGFGLEQQAEEILARVEFDEALLHGMLGFLLFAGALHVELNDLAREKWIIASLASVGLLTSTVLVGGITWIVLPLLGLELPFVYCLLFGALISPTDPIAVLGILKTAGAPRSLETKITGESLFNDGVAVVVFLALLESVTGHEATLGSVVRLFTQEAIGGGILGLGCGTLAYRMIRDVDSYEVEILITLALAMGSYALAGVLHASGPIAAVMAGLLMGNQGRQFAMSTKTREHVDTFWELVDELLNAVLFVLIGLEVLIITLRVEYVLAGAIAIPLVLLCRLVSVSVPVAALRLRRTFSPGAIRIMTWGGIRGGISVALALSLPAGAPREMILTITYCVVAFSIIVQGLTLEGLVRSSSAT